MNQYLVYEAAKRAFFEAHPDATPNQIEAACAAYAQLLGI